MQAPRRQRGGAKWAGAHAGSHLFPSLHALDVGGVGTIFTGGIVLCVKPWGANTQASGGG